MPLYEYQCSVCHHRFELLQKFSDEPTKVCLRCGGGVSRLISRSAIQFKGTGWYVTDYARKGAASSETEDNKKGKPKEGPSAVASEGSVPSKDSSTAPAPSSTPDS